MAEIPTGSVFGPTLAGAMSGGSDPFRNALQSMGAVPQALVLAQSLSTRGQKEYDRRQDVKLSRANTAANIAAKLGFGGSDLDAVFEAFATDEVQPKGTRGTGTRGTGSGVSVGAADTPVRSNISDLRALALELDQRSRVAYRPKVEPEDGKLLWPQSSEDKAAGISPSHYKPISRLQEKDRYMSPQLMEADENKARKASLRAALDKLINKRLLKIKRIERLQEISDNRKGRLNEGELEERAELKKAIKRLTSEISERNVDLEKAMRFKPDMGLENPATLIGLPADFVLDLKTATAVQSLLESGHPQARVALDNLGVPSNITAEDFKGIGSKIETYNRELGKVYRERLTAKRKQQADLLKKQTELDLAGRTLLMRGALHSRGYSGGNDDLIAKELAKLPDADAQAFIDDLGRKADLDSRIKEAGINANRVTRVINEYRGLNQKGTGTGTGTDPVTGQPSASAKDLQKELTAQRKIITHYENLQGGPDKRQIYPEEYERMLLAVRRSENLLNQYYAKTGMWDVQFPTSRHAAKHAWDKKMSMEEANLFMIQQGFGQGAGVHTDLGDIQKDRGVWNKRAAEKPAGEKPAAATTGAAAPKSFKEWRSMRSAAQNSGWDDALRAVALQAKRDGVSEAVYMSRAKEAVKAPDAMWGLPGALAHVESIYRNTKQSDPFEADELGGGTYDPKAGPSDEELLSAGSLRSKFSKLKAEWKSAANKSEVESRIRPWINSLGREDYEKYEDEWQAFLRENAR